MPIIAPQLAQPLGPLNAPVPRGGNNIDPMVVPPFGLPADKNTFMPGDVMQRRVGPQMQEQAGYSISPDMAAIIKMLIGA